MLPRPVPAQQLVSLHSGAPLALRAVDSGAAVLCFTSGTTAAPKVGVLQFCHFESLVVQLLCACSTACKGCWEAFYMSAYDLLTL